MNDLGKLIEDIYKHTGQKVEINDPIVCAAFLQSRLFEDAINNVKNNLPDEITKIVTKDIKQSVIDSRKELIDLSKSHIEEIEKSKNKIIESFKTEINNNAINIANNINSSLFNLSIFGILCGLIGGIFAWLIIRFIG